MESDCKRTAQSPSLEEATLSLALKQRSNSEFSCLVDSDEESGSASNSDSIEKETHDVIIDLNEGGLYSPKANSSQAENAKQETKDQQNLTLVACLYRVVQNRHIKREPTSAG